MKISHKLLTKKALNGLLDEFITRDSQVWDGSVERKRARVLNELERENAVIVFSEKDGSTHILSAAEYALTLDQHDS